MNSLLESVPDSAFGVASFMDYSCYDARSNDYPWKLNKRITTSTNAVRDAIIGLTLGHGGDSPEAYTRALYESYADSGVNWRTGTKKIVIMFGDDIPHYPDPGRDGKVGTADDLDFEEVVAELKSQGITVLALHSGTDDIPWKHLADETGGHYYKLGHAEASKIPEAITSMLVAEVEKIGELTLRAEPDYESWVSFTPNKHTNVGAKTTKTFTVKVTVPEGTKGGTYTFNIDVLGDGTVLETQEVTITTVREPTPSPTVEVTQTPARTSTQTPTPARTSTRTPKPTLSVVPTRTPTSTPTRTTPIPSPTTSFEPAILVLPTSHNFGSMYVAGTSSPMMFTITNTGSEDLMIGPLSIKGEDNDEFRIRSNNCRGRAIAQSRSCTVNVLFAPTSEGEKSANLRILSNDPDTPTLNVPLQATAVISEQESQLRNCNVAIKENGDTIISFLYDLSPADEAAWLAARFEIAKTAENELRRIYNVDAAIITISAIETTVIIPNLIEPKDKTYTMPELNLRDIQRRYQNLTNHTINVSIVPTTVTIEFPDKYTETFVETDIVPETTHTISGVIIPWIMICSPPSGAKLRNATTINVWGSDDIQRVSLLITGVGGEKRWKPDSDPPFCFEWDPNDTNVSGGSYQIEATGFVDDEGDVPVTYSIIVDVEKPMVPPATLFGVLIVFITAGVVAAGAAASSLRTTTEMRGRNGTGNWHFSFCLHATKRIT
jgi:ribosomal protein S6